MTSRTASSPGKLILSGEHAVVHGAPALAIAVSQRATVTFTPDENSSTLSLQFSDQSPVAVDVQDLPPLAEETHARYQQFLSGTLPIHDVVPRPAELLLTAVGNCGIASGGNLVLHSDIPLGAGMGSSAACLLALLKVLNPEADSEWLYKEALRCEHYQHGHSSGIDVATSLNGGLLVSQQGIHTRERKITLPPFSLYDSGKPDSTTGECVTRVAQQFPDTDPIWVDFEFSTREALFALQSGDAEAWRDQLQENHRLLQTIGVVPDAVAAGIAHIESRGSAAKICGAGSIRGNQGGLVLVWGDHEVEVPKDWKKLDCSLSATGTHDHALPS